MQWFSECLLDHGPWESNVGFSHENGLEGKSIIWLELKIRPEIAIITGAGSRSGNTNMKFIATGLVATLLLIGFAPFAAEAMILIVLEFGPPSLFQP
jgi:hypothetical protein